MDAIVDPVSLYEPIYDSGGDAICVMDQVSDTKNTDERWTERIALKDALKQLDAPGTAHSVPALLRGENPDGGLRGNRYFAGPGEPAWKRAPSTPSASIYKRPPEKSPAAFPLLFSGQSAHIGKLVGAALQGEGIRALRCVSAVAAVHCTVGTALGPLTVSRRLRRLLSVIGSLRFLTGCALRRLSVRTAHTAAGTAYASGAGAQLRITAPERILALRKTGRGHHKILERIFRRHFQNGLARRVFQGIGLAAALLLRELEHRIGLIAAVHRVIHIAAGDHDAAVDVNAVIRIQSRNPHCRSRLLQ